MKYAALIAVLAIAGCNGTSMLAKGSICGQPFELAVNDRKSREGFKATVAGQCSADTPYSIAIDSTGSQTDQAGFEVANKGLDAVLEVLPIVRTLGYGPAQFIPSGPGLPAQAQSDEVPDR